MGTDNEQPNEKHNSNRTTPTIPRLDFRFPSSFENGTLRGSHAIRESVASEPVVVVVGSDGEEVKIIEPPARTVNYRKCILPFILGVALMITGIVMLPIGLGLGGKYDTFSYCGAISILFALKFMAFWYTCSLEVQDREMPKMELPKTKSKSGKPTWMQKYEQQKSCQSPVSGENLITPETMVEMSEISTPTSSSCNVVQASVEPPEVEEADFAAANNSGCANPSFNAHEDTVC